MHAQTAQSAPDSTEFPYYSMAQGYLRPQLEPSEQGLSAYGNVVNQGDVLSFTVTITESNPTEAEIYCDAVSLSPFTACLTRPRSFLLTVYNRTRASNTENCPSTTTSTASRFAPRRITITATRSCSFTRHNPGALSTHTTLARLSPSILSRLPTKLCWYFVF